METTETTTTKNISPPSQSVSWWPVHEYVDALIKSIRFPMLGTPAWLALPDDDPAKLAAVLDGGCHHALRLELNQEARAEASKDISAAVDWRGIAQELTQLHDFRKTHPWARRAS